MPMNRVVENATGQNEQGEIFMQAEFFFLLHAGRPRVDTR